MPVYNWEDGIVSASDGGPVDIVVGPEVQTTRRTLYVDGSHANASDNNTGTEKNAPKATIAGTNHIGSASGAFFDAVAGDIIWVAARHTESLTITVSKAGLSIIGGGQGSSRPTLTAYTSEGVVFNISSANTEIDNFILAENYPAEVPGNITDILVKVDASYCRLKRLLIVMVHYKEAIVIGGVATATFCECRELQIGNANPNPYVATNLNNPIYGIQLAQAARCYGFSCIDSVFDAGTTAWQFGAIEASSVAVTGYLIQGNTFRNGATAQFTSTSANGRWSNNTLSPSSRIVIAAPHQEFINGIVDFSDDGGDTWLSGHDVMVCGTVWWVDSVNGSNSNAGNKRDKPLATIVQAIANFTAGDIIVVERNHSEAFVAASNAARTSSLVDLKIYGLGTTTDRPTLTTTSTAVMLRLNGTGGELNGFQFPASTVAPASYRLYLAGAGSVLKNCSFVCGALDTSTVYAVGLGYTVMDNTATVSATGAVQWLYSDPDATSNLIQNNSLDGAGIGWSQAGMYLPNTGGSEKVTLLHNTLVGGADVSIGSTATGALVVNTIANSSQAIIWTA